VPPRKNWEILGGPFLAGNGQEPPYPALRPGWPEAAPRLGKPTRGDAGQRPQLGLGRPNPRPILLASELSRHTGRWRSDPGTSRFQQLVCYTRPPAGSPKLGDTAVDHLAGSSDVWPKLDHTGRTCKLRTMVRESMTIDESRQSRSIPITTCIIIGMVPRSIVIDHYRWLSISIDGHRSIAIKIDENEQKRRFFHFWSFLAKSQKGGSSALSALLGVTLQN